MAEALQLQADMNEFKENFIQEVDQAKARSPLVIRPRKVKVDLDLEFSANNSSNLPSPLTPLRLQPCGKLVLLGPGKGEDPRAAGEESIVEKNAKITNGGKTLEEPTGMEDGFSVETYSTKTGNLEEGKPGTSCCGVDIVQVERNLVPTNVEVVQNSVNVALADVSNTEDAPDLSQTDLSAMESRNDIDDILLGDGSLSFDVSDMVLDAGENNTDTEGNDDDLDVDEEQPAIQASVSGAMSSNLTGENTAFEGQNAVTSMSCAD